MTTYTEKSLRELDAWIAEHVMGWKCRFCVRGVKKKFPKREYARIRHNFPHWPEQEPDIACYHFGNFTTDLAAAMQVLEKCAVKTEELECLYIGKVGDEFIIGLKIEKLEAVAKTLPLAIALFAKQLFSK